MKLKLILRVLFGLMLFSSMIACSKSDETPSTSNKQEQKEIWTCPMHPQIKANKPGQCPICGMDLVKIQNVPNP